MCFESTTVKIPSSTMLALTCRTHLMSLRLISCLSDTIIVYHTIVFRRSLSKHLVKKCEKCFWATNSSAKKVCATGAGSASPVVSMMMPSKGLPCQGHAYLEPLPHSYYTAIPEFSSFPSFNVFHIFLYSSHIFFLYSSSKFVSCELDVSPSQKFAYAAFSDQR